GDQVDELLEPPVERRPGALALHVRAPRRAELVAPREDRGEGGREAAAVVCRTAARAGYLTAGHLVLRRDEARRPDLPGFEQHDAEAFEMGRQDERIRRFEERVFLLIAHSAERDDVVALRDRHTRRSGEHERARAAALAVGDPVGEQLIDGLALAHLPQGAYERP